MSGQVIMKPRCRQQLTLETVVRHQLRAGHQNRSVHVGSQTTHELTRSLLLNNPEKSIKGVLVVSLLLLWQLSVVHHTDIDHICWVAESSANTSCENTAQ